MGDTESTETKPKHDNKTITLVTTALVAACNLISPSYQKIMVCACPCITLAGAYCFVTLKSYIYYRMERKKTTQTYQTILDEHYAKLKKCTNSHEKAKIKARIEKFEADRDTVRIKQIKKFI